ncbi:MAG: DNA (cytosine-5-)-methyltransferase [Prevotellaceae bacterium]|jgi:DNA (cytosine-5)-methyltransferase 1|nr:DNA (cytosine-5-)-methyltransferase [Prevotellaceae bacterium]
MTHGSLFSGIGGFDLAARRAGLRNVFWCENDEFCRKVLRKHFWHSNQLNDIKNEDFTRYRGRVDVVSGGFPCQDISIAGKQAGLTEGKRSSLFFEMVRAVAEVQPKFVVWENVPEVINYLDIIRDEMRAVGYNNMWGRMFCAWEFGYPHKRKRFFAVHFADTECNGLDKASYLDDYADKMLQSETQIRKLNHNIGRAFWNITHCEDFRRDDGLSNKLVQNQLKGYGNAIVPDIGELIFRGLKTFISR